MGLTFQHIPKTSQHIFNQSVKKKLYNTFLRILKFVYLKVEIKCFKAKIDLNSTELLKFVMESLYFCPF